MNADKTVVARLCVLAFDGMSALWRRKTEQLMALAASFVLLCEAAGLDPYEVYVASKNLMVDETHSERRDHRFAAMKYHIEKELLSNGA